QPVAGVPVSVKSVLVDGAPDTNYLATKSTDGEGKVTFTVPQASTVTFGCDDSAHLNDGRVVVPNALEHFLGKYHADPAVVSRAGGGTPVAIDGVTVTEFGDVACRQVLI